MVTYGPFHQPLKINFFRQIDRLNFLIHFKHFWNILVDIFCGEGFVSQEIKVGSAVEAAVSHQTNQPTTWLKSTSFIQKEEVRQKLHYIHLCESYTKMSFP